ncbi:hypothetical protein JTB14_027393 [Gonioctena quinquepunctata]|nr:hypothetical protein JTB14_027393 [Gonioctena quinquepunctata]
MVELRCDSAVNNRKEAYIRFKLNPNQENLLEYKKQDATAKKTFKQSQRQSWRMYCESLNRTTPMKDVWQKVNRFKNRRMGNTTRMDPEAEWVEKFHHKIAPNTANTAPISQLTETAMGNHSLSKNFEMGELNRALKQTSNTAPGKDNITYSMLYHLPEGLKRSLLNIFNRIWNNEIAIPTEWKDYLVIPIHKHGKPKEEENSYRPISLASCILKTFERMLKNRLEHWLEHYTKLPASQYGFRRSVFPYNRDIFPDNEFLASSVTYRPDPGISSEGARPDPGLLNEEASPDPGISDEEETPSLTNNTQEINKTIQESKITSKTTITKPVLSLKKTQESMLESGVQNAKRNIQTGPNDPCCSGSARQNTRNIVTPESLRTYPKAYARKTIELVVVNQKVYIYGHPN